MDEDDLSSEITSPVDKPPLEDDLSSEIPSPVDRPPLQIERLEQLRFELETPQIKGRLDIVMGGRIEPSFTYTVLCCATVVTFVATHQVTGQPVVAGIVAIATFSLGFLFVTRFRKGQP